MPYTYDFSTLIEQMAALGMLYYMYILCMYILCMCYVGKLEKLAHSVSSWLIGGILKALGGSGRTTPAELNRTTAGQLPGNGQPGNCRATAGQLPGNCRATQPGNCRTAA